MFSTLTYTKNVIQLPFLVTFFFFTILLFIIIYTVLVTHYVHSTFQTKEQSNKTNGKIYDKHGKKEIHESVTSPFKLQR